MPKIFFEGREYDNPEQMTPEARARYEKAVKMLPDRDSNGIPDLLEVDGITAKPAASAAEPAVKVPTPAQSSKEAAAARKKGKLILVGVIAIISLCIACIGVFMVVIFSVMRSSDAYQLALETLKSHPTAQQVLGVPIEDGLFITGSVEENDSSGTADLEIPVSGVNRSGTLHVTAVKEENTWRLTYLMLDAGGQEYQLVP